MKVIDLLNKIANGEEVPKRIRYKGDYWYLKQKYTNVLPYYSNGYDKDNLFTGEEEECFSQSLNDEVEIIEEDKKIEHLDIYNCFHIMGDNQISRLRLDDNFQNISDKINEIIDYIKGSDKE